MRRFAQAFLAEQGEMNRRCKRAKCLIGANVRGGLLAANVLFARGECEDKTTAPFRISRLPSKAAGHLANIFVTRGDDANERTAITRREAKALAFHSHDVGLRRRLHKAKRNTFSNDANEQSA